MILEALMVERSALIAAIEEEFKQRLPDYHKSRREELTTLAGGDAGDAQRQSDGVGGGAAA